MKIKINTTVPQPILDALPKARLQYTSLVSIYHCIELGADWWCGTAGDGDNGAYEWFVWSKGELTTSNQGYGTPEYALTEVLIQEIK